MHTFTLRLFGVLTHAATYLAVIAVFVSLSDLLHPSGLFSPVDLKVKGVDAIFVSKKGVEQAQLNIELHADLRPEFTWNTKQLYVSVLAEYATETSPKNVVTLWDRIVVAKEDAKLDIRKLPKKFPFVFAAEMNDNKGLLGLDYNITLAVDIMPKVGRLRSKSETFSGMRLPNYHIEPKSTS